MQQVTAFSKELLECDCQQVTQKVCEALKQQVMGTFKKKGVVIGFSGGIDSSAVGALCVEAFGKERVFGLLMPERDSAAETLGLSQCITDHLGIDYIVEDITPMLQSVGCYQRRDEAIRTVIPQYTSDYQCKIVMPQITGQSRMRLFSVVVRSPEGKESKARLTPTAYLQIVAATNFKQRIRKMLEYYHADRLNYATTGTPNRQEYDQGFFVKLGDGSADVKPIAHLYKTQVYQLARYLGVPESICSRPPTTDTYSMEQGQDEFYFSVSYEKMDLCLYGKNHGFSPEEVAEATDMTIEQVTQVYEEIDSKRVATKYLHTAPLTVEPIEEINRH